jgi:hypothetical protein
MSRLQKFRFVALTSLAATVGVVLGALFVYLSLRAWYFGEFRARWFLVREMTSPVEFWTVTCAALLLGAYIAVGSLISFGRVFAGDVESKRLTTAHPAVYGGVRPSIRYFFILILVAIIASMIIA